MYNHQHPSMATCFGPFLDNPQANICMQKLSSVPTIHYGIPYCLQDVGNNNFKCF